MSNVLIGSSGFVGSTLLKQRSFENLYRSTNIGTIRGKKLDFAICAAAPAQKWIANRDPESDLRNIEGLIEHLNTISCKTFVLISTVDVFANPIGVNEDTRIEENGLHPYGLHRRLLEKVAEGNFTNHLIVRLPGLVGPGLRKNIIFDLLNDNNLHSIESRGIFQFYPIINLWYDIQIALRAGLKLVHLTAEPIDVAEIAEAGFNRVFNQILSGPPASYDFQSKHAKLFGGRGLYQYSKRETIQAVRTYAQSESLCIKTEGEAGR